MVIKLALVVAVLIAFLLAVVFATFRYFQQVEKHEHEKDMFREKRDADLLSGEDSYIERELEQEKNND